MARQLRVRVLFDKNAHEFTIGIEDDGIGMTVDPGGERGESGHYGIAIMRERASRLGGELTLDSVPGAGTRVRLYFPAMEPQTGSGL